jgi:hypothetical protein
MKYDELNETFDAVRLYTMWYDEIHIAVRYDTIHTTPLNFFHIIFSYDVVRYHTMLYNNVRYLTMLYNSDWFFFLFFWDDLKYIYNVPFSGHIMYDGTGILKIIRKNLVREIEVVSDTNNRSDTTCWETNEWYQTRTIPLMPLVAITEVVSDTNNRSDTTCWWNT